MRKHIRTYLEYFSYGEQDCILCENCGKRANDIHHLVYKSKGGTDDITNLMALCRECHNLVHNGYGSNFNNKLKEIHKKFIDDQL